MSIILSYSNEPWVSPEQIHQHFSLWAIKQKKSRDQSAAKTKKEADLRDEKAEGLVRCICNNELERESELWILEVAYCMLI